MVGKRISCLISPVLNRCKSKRLYASSSKHAGSLSTPLSKPLIGLDTRTGDAKFNPFTKTQVTRLSNGLTVASEDHWGQFATLGVLVNSGSRNEVGYTSGVNHFIEKLAFNSTERFKSREQIGELLEKHGGICDCQTSRDTMVHAVSLQKDGLATAVDLLSQVVLKPVLSDEEISMAQQAIAFELENLHMNPNKELQMMELIHNAAFRANTLGLPRICPPLNITAIDRDMILTYLRHQCTPDQMVLAGSGMPHERLVQLAEQFFTQRPVWEGMSLDSRYQTDRSHAQYTGGIEKISEDLSNVSLGPTPMPELAHICLGMESCSHQDEDFVAFCVLNTLMGGGGSFSAGGPGKGMYTRLYTNVLNRHYWIENATAFNHSYDDTGLFVFYGSAHPTKLKDLIVVLTAEIKRMTQSVNKEELSRARRQLQSMLMMNLESRPIVFEDIGRQVLSSGERKPAQYFYDQIQRITESDIQRVAHRLLRSPVAVAGLGTLDTLPELSTIQNMLAIDQSRMKRAFGTWGSS